MRWKRYLVAAGLMGAGVVAPPFRAEEEPQPPGPPPPSEAQKEQPAQEPRGEQTQRPSFWGDRLALYLEVAGGTASAQKVESSIETLASAVTQTRVDLDDVATGVITVG